ncbi:MAG: hypothetical protein IPP17_10060 [Bacteroidetes bacterium]|nr:hypothetical protein [Bacteroidota bacterium]
MEPQRLPRSDKWIIHPYSLSHSLT